MSHRAYVTGRRGVTSPRPAAVVVTASRVKPSHDVGALAQTQLPGHVGVVAGGLKSGGVSPVGTGSPTTLISLVTGCCGTTSLVELVLEYSDGEEG